MKIDLSHPPSAVGAVPWNEAEDETLLQAIAAGGDRAAFAELFHRYAGRIKGFLIRIGSPADQAEEGAQEVMVAIWRQAARFDPAKAGAATWIYTIARNKRIDLIRRATRPAPCPNDPHFEPEPEPSSECQLSGAERDARVRAAMLSLPDGQRMVIRLAFFAGLSHAEIAEELSLPIGTVKSRLRLSFTKLREALGAGFAQELVDD